MHFLKPILPLRIELVSLIFLCATVFTTGSEWLASFEDSNAFGLA